VGVSQVYNSLVVGRTTKKRSGASLIIDDTNGSSSSLAIYQKLNSFSPLLNLYNGNGDLVSYMSPDGSIGVNYVKLKTNKILNANGGLTYGNNIAGDVVVNDSMSTAKPVTNWTCVTSGTPGVWQQSAHIVVTGVTASRPVLTAVDIGVMYFDTTLAINGKPIWWTGSKWVDASGNQV
jgi:hypothetical protein